MKRFLTTWMAVSAILALSSCKEDSPVEELDGPTITWASNPEFGTVTIDEDLDATLNVTAPAGIKEFTVEVKSDIMEAALKIIGISTTTLDLINDETVITILNGVTDGQLPTGEALLDQKNVDFNITALVKMINKITEEDSDHTFVVKVIDNNAKSAEKSCTFHRVGVETPEYAAPTAEWVGHSFDDPMELSAQMDVKININAPAGFKAFTVVVESAPLNNMGNLWWLTSRYEAELELLVFAAWHGVKLIPIPIQVYYFPKSQRVSHFRPGIDFLRISILNTILCMLAIVYGAPRMFLSELRKIIGL